MTERTDDKPLRDGLYELLEDAAEIRVVLFGTDKWRTLTDAEEDCLIRALSSRPSLAATKLTEYSGVSDRIVENAISRLINNEGNTHVETMMVAEFALQSSRSTATTPRSVTDMERSSGTRDRKPSGPGKATMK